MIPIYYRFVGVNMDLEPVMVCRLVQDLYAK